MKTHSIIAITTAAAALFLGLPEMTAHLGEGLHFATLIISGHHILQEISHSIRS